MKYLAALSVLLASSPAISASDTTFGMLVEECKSAQAIALGAEIDPEMLRKASFCTGYIGGFLDGVTIERFAGAKGASYCLPEKGVSPELVINLMRVHLDLNPETSEYTARLTTYAVLSRAFPCSGK